MNSVDNSDDEDDEEVASQSSKKSRKFGISYTDMPVLYQEPKEEDIRRRAAEVTEYAVYGLYTRKPQQFQT